MLALQLLGSLGLLIYGMKMMSEALQKMAGPQLRHILAKTIDRKQESGKAFVKHQNEQL